MGEITHKGKKAVRVNAKEIMWASTDKSQKYDIDGDEVWVPRSLSKFTESEDSSKKSQGHGTLVIQEWFYNQLFPNG